MRTLLDTNAVLRHLLGDIPEQSRVATAAVEGAATVYPEVIAECVYVLGGAIYGLERTAVAEILIAFLGEVSCPRKHIMRRALMIFAKTKLDFVDCILAAASELECEHVLTFDKELSRIIDESGRL